VQRFHDGFSSRKSGDCRECAENLSDFAGESSLLFLPDFRNAAQSPELYSPARGCRSLAMSPLQPVWCDAPTPRPLSPLKHSWNKM
jgi:hypothetical protein